MNPIPCFLCGSLLTIRTDKNHKLYMICEGCGSQHFIRRKQGMERLREMSDYFLGQKLELAARMESLLHVQARLNEIDILKKEIRRLEFEAGPFFRDKQKLRARDAVQKRVDALLVDLERTAAEIDEPVSTARTAK